MYALFCLLVSSLVSCVLFFWWHKHRATVNRIPGPPTSNILFGNVLLFWKPPNKGIKQHIHELYQTLLDLCAEYRNQGVFRLWLGPFHAIFVLTNSNNVERLLSSSVNLDKGVEYEFFRPWLGDGLLLAAKDLWKPKRKLLTAAFHFKMLENFVPIFGRHSDLLVNKIERQLVAIDGGQWPSMGQVYANKGTAIIDDVRPLFEDCTLNIINETSMGVITDGDDQSQPSQSTENHLYRVALKEAFRIAVYRSIHPYYWIDWVFGHTKVGKDFGKYVHTMHTYTDQIIRKRLAEFKSDKNFNAVQDDQNRKDRIFLDILLRKFLKDDIRSAPKIFSIENMHSDVNTFILGGHDTTAMALTFTLFLLGHHPRCQQLVHQELFTVLVDGPSESKFTIDQIKQMRFLECCIKETLRLYPSVQIIGRRLSAPLKLTSGETIPALSNVYVPILAVHLDEKHFENPHQFKPERFANATITHPYAFIPFSAGPRNCIGQKYAMLELKYILASILIQYRVTSITKPEDIRKDFGPVNKPYTPVKMSFEKIELGKI